MIYGTIAAFCSEAAYAEGRLMDYAKERLERAGEGAPAMESHEQHSGMRSVQNLEAIINEGLRVGGAAEVPGKGAERGTDLYI